MYPSVPILNIKPKASNNQLEFYWSRPQNTGTNNFRPNNISSIQFWLDANNPATLTLAPNSYNVTKVTEQAKRVNFSTIQTGPYLIAQPSTIGSSQTLWFNNQYSDNAYLEGPFNMPTTGDAFLVFKAKPQFSQSWRAIFGTNITGGLNLEYINGVSNQLAPGQTNLGNGSPITTLVPDTTYLIYFGWSTNVTQLGLFGNQPQVGQIQNTPVQTSTLRIGTDLGTCVQMNLGELLFFNSTLTLRDKQKMEGYLAWKWNLKSQLPTSHPYYNNDPRSGPSPLQGYTLTCPNIPYQVIYSASTNYALVSNITNQTDYRFSLSAFNLNGSGPSANFLTTQSGLLPSSPTNLNITTLDPTTINVSWILSQQPNEAQVKWFVINVTQTAPIVSSFLRSAHSYDRNRTLTIANPGTYSLIVYSVNDVGYCYQTEQNTISFTM